MTRDDRRKKAVRAHAARTGRTYADAATSLRAGQSTAARLRDELAAALEAAGWPVTIEPNPPSIALPVYAGPATIHVSPAVPRPSGATGEHPDDHQTARLTVTVWAPSWAADHPWELGQAVGVDAHEIAGDGPVAEIVAEINRVVADARGRDLADLAAIDECDVCEDAYPLEALFESTRAAVSVCPCCAFDGDLLDPDPAHLAFQIDRAAAESLTVPAGWAAVQALLCCLAGPDLLVLLRHEWRAAEIPYLPSRCWGDVLTTWIWLPPAPRRSAALVDLGCGASLGRVIAAIDQVHPGLRAACRARLDEADHASLADESGDDLRDERSAAQDSMRIPDGTFDRIWPAVVAYTVAMLTQQAERPRRAPWHVLDSFELADWCHAVGSDLNVWDVEKLLYYCIIVIRDALDPRDPGWDDYR